MAGEIWVKVRPRRIPPTVFGRGERPGRMFFFFFTGGSLPKKGAVVERTPVLTGSVCGSAARSNKLTGNP